MKMSIFWRTVRSEVRGNARLTCSCLFSTMRQCKHYEFINFNPGSRDWINNWIRASFRWLMGKNNAMHYYEPSRGWFFAEHRWTNLIDNIEFSYNEHNPPGAHESMPVELADLIAVELATNHGKPFYYDFLPSDCPNRIQGFEDVPWPEEDYDDAQACSQCGHIHRRPAWYDLEDRFSSHVVVDMQGSLQQREMPRPSHESHVAMLRAQRMPDFPALGSRRERSFPDILQTYQTQIRVQSKKYAEAELLEASAACIRKIRSIVTFTQQGLEAQHPETVPYALLLPPNTIECIITWSLSNLHIIFSDPTKTLPQRIYCAIQVMKKVTDMLEIKVQGACTSSLATFVEVATSAVITFSRMQKDILTGPTMFHPVMMSQYLKDVAVCAENHNRHKLSVKLVDFATQLQNLNSEDPEHARLAYSITNDIIASLDKYVNKTQCGSSLEEPWADRAEIHTLSDQFINWRSNNVTMTPIERQIWVMRLKRFRNVMNQVFITQEVNYIINIKCTTRFLEALEHLICETLADKVDFPHPITTVSEESAFVVQGVSEDVKTTAETSARESISDQTDVIPTKTGAIVDPDWQIKQQLGLNLIYHNFTWKTTDAAQTEIVNWQWPDQCFSAVVPAAHKSIFQRYSYMKFDVVVEVEVNSTQMLAGRLLGVLMPGDTPLSAQNALQTHGQFLDASASNKLQLRFNYLHPCQYLPMYNNFAGTGFQNMCRFVLYVWNPLTAPNTTTQTVNGYIKVHYENVHLVVPTNVDNTSAVIPSSAEILKAKTAAKGKPLTYKMQGQSDTFVTNTKPFFNSQQVQTDDVGMTRSNPRTNAGVALTDLIRRNNIVDTLTWNTTQTSGTILWSSLVSPNAFLNTGMSHFSNYFAYWAGSIDITLTLASSRFQAGEIVMVFAPRTYTDTDLATMGTLSTFPCTYLNLSPNNDKKEYTLKLPYISAFSAMATRSDVGNLMYATGRVALVVINPLVSNDTSPQTVGVNVLAKAGEDFEFIYPVSTYSIQGVEEQAGLVPITSPTPEVTLAKSSAVPSIDILPVPEAISYDDIRHIMSRPSAHVAGSLDVAKASTGVMEIPIIGSEIPRLSYVAGCFAYYMADSVKVQLSFHTPTTSNIILEIAFHPYLSLDSVTQLAKNEEFTSLGVYRVKPNIQNTVFLTVPYVKPYQWLPTASWAGIDAGDMEIFGKIFINIVNLSTTEDTTLWYETLVAFENLKVAGVTSYFRPYSSTALMHEATTKPFIKTKRSVGATTANSSDQPLVAEINKLTARVENLTTEKSTTDARVTDLHDRLARTVDDLNKARQTLAAYQNDQPSRDAPAVPNTPSAPQIYPALAGNTNITSGEWKSRYTSEASLFTPIGDYQMEISTGRPPIEVTYAGLARVISRVHEHSRSSGRMQIFQDDTLPGVYRIFLKDADKELAIHAMVQFGYKGYLYKKDHATYYIYVYALETQGLLDVLPDATIREFTATSRELAYAANEITNEVKDTTKVIKQDVDIITKDFKTLSDTMINSTVNIEKDMTEIKSDFKTATADIPDTVNKIAEMSECVSAAVKQIVENPLSAMTTVVKNQFGITPMKIFTTCKDLHTILTSQSMPNAILSTVRLLADYDICYTKISQIFSIVNEFVTEHFDNLKDSWTRKVHQFQAGSEDDGSFTYFLFRGLAALALGLTSVLGFKKMISVDSVLAFVKSSMVPMKFLTEACRCGQSLNTMVKVFGEWMNYAYKYLRGLYDPGYGITEHITSDELINFFGRVEQLCKPGYALEIVRDIKLQHEVYNLYSFSNYVLAEALNKALPYLSPSIVMTISKSMKQLSDLITKVDGLVEQSSFRVDPYHVSLYGAPGVGKSAMMNHIADAIANEMQLPALGRYYDRSDGDVFWSGYDGEPVTKIDDFFASTDSETIKELIQIKSNATYRLNMADLSEKGRLFKSEVIVSTTNVLFPKPNSINHHAALWRRRNALVHIIKDNNDEPSPTNAKYRLVNPNPAVEKTEYLTESLCWEEFKVKIIKDAREYLETQYKLVANERRRVEVNSKYLDKVTKRPIPNFSADYSAESVEAGITRMFIDCPNHQGPISDCKCFSSPCLCHGVPIDTCPNVEYVIDQLPEATLDNLKGDFEFNRKLNFDVSTMKFLPNTFWSKETVRVQGGLDEPSTSKHPVTTFLHGLAKLESVKKDTALNKATIEADLMIIENVNDSKQRTIMPAEFATAILRNSWQPTSHIKMHKDAVLRPYPVNYNSVVYNSCFGETQDECVFHFPALKDITTDPTSITLKAFAKLVGVPTNQVYTGFDQVFKLNTDHKLVKRSTFFPLMQDVELVRQKVGQLRGKPAYIETLKFNNTDLLDVDIEILEMMQETMATLIKEKDIWQKIEPFATKLFDWSKTKTAVGIFAKIYQSKVATAALNVWHCGLAVLKIIGGAIVAFSSISAFCDWWWPSNLPQGAYASTGRINKSITPVQKGPLTIKVQGVTNGVAAVAQQVIPSAVQSHIIQIRCVNNTLGKAFKLSGIQYGGRRVICPGHLGLFFEFDCGDISNMEVLWNGYWTPFRIQENKIYRIGGDIGARDYVDIIAFELPISFSDKKIIKNHFITEQELGRFKTANALVIYNGINQKMADIEQLQIKKNSTTIVANLERPGAAPVPFSFSSTVQYSPVTMSKEGDCGSIIYILDEKIANKIVGMHIAGGYGVSFATIITKEMILALDDAMSYHNEPTEMEIVLPQEVIPTLEGMTCIPEGQYALYGYVAPQMAAHLPTKTDLRPSVIQDQVFQHTSEPAALTQNDSRLNEGVSPLKLALSKYGHPTSPFPTTYLDIAQKQLENNFLSHLKTKRWSGKPGLLTMTEIIHGSEETGFEPMNMSSSPGWPYTTTKPPGEKGKSYLFDLEQNKIANAALFMNYQRREAEAKEGRRVASVWVDCLKDERRPIEKVKDGKTRLFTIPPADLSMLTRKYFGDFAQAFYDARFNIPSAIGVDCESSEWTVMFNKLDEIEGEFICGDFKCFDGTALPSCMWSTVNAINTWYGDSEENQRIRRVIMHEVIHTVQLVKNSVYGTIQGVPSGWNLTSILDTCVQNQYFHVAWIGLAKDLAPDMIGEFYTKTRYVGYGDDNILKISSDCISWYNQETIAAYLAQFGIEYTNAAKCGVDRTTPRKDISFLKRKFVPDELLPSIMRAPIDVETIYELTNWVRSSPSDEDATLENCRTALRFAFQHGRKFYEETRVKINDALRNNGLPLLADEYQCLYLEHLAK